MAPNRVTSDKKFRLKDIDPNDTGEATSEDKPPAAPPSCGAGAKRFLDLHSELAKRGMILRLVEAHASVRDLLRIEGAGDRVDHIDRFATVGDLIEHFRKQGA